MTKSATLLHSISLWGETFGMASLRAIPGPHPSFQSASIMRLYVSLLDGSPDLCMAPLEILEHPLVSAR